MKTSVILFLTILSLITSKTRFKVYLGERLAATIEINDGLQPIVVSHLSPVPTARTTISGKWKYDYTYFPFQPTYCLSFGRDDHCHDIVRDDYFLREFTTFWGVILDWSQGDPFIIWDSGIKPDHPTEQGFKDNLKKLTSKFIFIDEEDGLIRLK
jgi:hypothetical protein